MGRPDPRDEMVLERAAGHLRAALSALGLDLTGADLADTPKRTVRLWADLFSGLDEEPPAIEFLAPAAPPAGLVAVHDLSFYSICAHHLLPFFGRAHLAYWPVARVAGLGDLARVLRHFARRPTFQERLALDVSQHLERQLAPRGVGVILEGRHLCLEMRGEERRVRFETSSFHGVLEDPAVRAEFLAGLAPRRGRRR